MHGNHGKTALIYSIVTLYLGLRPRTRIDKFLGFTIIYFCFQVSDERREQGTINNTKEGFGFIQCADRDAKIFFHFSECLDVSRQPREGDDCEFTVADDPNHAGQLMATRYFLANYFRN